MPARFGRPFNPRISSNESVLIVEPTLGLDASQPSVDAPLGSTPNSDNYIMREGALEPRPCITPRNTNSMPFGSDTILGGHELQSVAALRYPLVSGTTRWAVYGQSATPNGWSVLSYVSSNGLSDPLNLASSDYVDFTQTYWPLRDENLAIAGVGSYQSLYCTQSNTLLFSTLTGAPQARFVTTFDNFLLAGNIKQGSTDLVQRIQWSDRGDPSTWTQGLAGFEDLMALKGQITRLVGQENRIVVFAENEIWQGLRGDGVFQFSFAPYDRSVGCPYSWTVSDTPQGLVFMGKDYQMYLLPKGGGGAQPIGQRLHRTIRNTIDHPERAWSVYNRTSSQYELYYPIKAGSGKPQRAVYLDINTGSWAPQSFDLQGGSLSLTRGFEIYVSSSATTWGGLSAASIRWADINRSWADLGGSSEERAICVASSAGTLYTFNSTATTDHGLAVQSYWRSTGLMGEDASHQKTVTEFRVDYAADSASSLSVRYSSNQGASFGVSEQLNLPAASGLSQSVGYPYFASRFPSFEISSEGVKNRIYRFFLKYRRGGR